MRHSGQKRSSTRSGKSSLHGHFKRHRLRYFFERYMLMGWSSQLLGVLHSRECQRAYGLPKCFARCFCVLLGAERNKTLKWESELAPATTPVVLSGREVREWQQLESAVAAE